MMLVTSAAQAAAQARVNDVLGTPYLLHEYFGRSPRGGIYVPGNEANDDGRPQGFLVHQPAGAVTRPHFHATNQYQVFVGGSGTLGKVATPPVTVQYAGAHTPYGPIVSGAEGVTYFTLRQRWDPGAKYMPAMRDLLERGRQRQRVAEVAVSTPQALAKRIGSACEAIIEPEDDGVLGAVLRLGPGASAAAPRADEGGGQYHVVLAGTLRHGGEHLPALSCQFAFPDEGGIEVRAGADGLELLVLRFPRS